MADRSDMRAHAGLGAFKPEGKHSGRLLPILESDYIHYVHALEILEIRNHRIKRFYFLVDLASYVHPASF